MNTKLKLKNKNSGSYWRLTLDVYDGLMEKKTSDICKTSIVSRKKV